MVYKIGTKQTIKAIESRKAIGVYAARDADIQLRSRLIQLCEKEGLTVTWYDTMSDLGKKCGIDVGAAMAAEVADEE